MHAQAYHRDTRGLRNELRRGKKSTQRDPLRTEVVIRFSCRFNLIVARSRSLNYVKDCEAGCSGVTLAGKGKEEKEQGGKGDMN